MVLMWETEHRLDSVPAEVEIRERASRQVSLSLCYVITAGGVEERGGV